MESFILIKPIAAAAMVFFSGQVLEMDTYETCISELQKTNAVGIVAVCVKKEPTSQENISVMLDNIVTMQTEIERRRAAWAKTDRAWCIGIKHHGLDPDKQSAWPHGKKPGPCPEFFMK